MTTKHTPGPWTVAPEAVEHVDNYPKWSITAPWPPDEDENSHFQLAQVWSYPEEGAATLARDKSNARLIASAPDLLAMCHAAANVIESEAERCEELGEVCAPALQLIGIHLATVINQAEGAR